MKKFLLSTVLVVTLTVAVEAQEVTTFAGYHTQLYGYTDKRYLGPDQGDYLKTLASYSGIEFFQKGFRAGSTESAGLVMGAASTVYVQDGFAKKTLYAVSGPTKLIPEKVVPHGEGARVSHFQVSASAFAGYSDEWWGGEGGISVFVRGYDEQVRRKYDRLGNIVEVAGRGWVFGDGSTVLPNFRLRLGAEQLPHFVLSLYRGHYDPGYGVYQALVLVPFTEAVTLTVGGAMLPTSSFFVEPLVRLGDLSTSVRVGTILNYNDSALTRVGILEGAFVSGSVGYRW